MLVATRGESALDCVPFDVSMLDNATGDYSADPSTSAEKDDIDVITVPLANVGKSSITPPPPPQGLPLQVNFGADRSAPQEAGTALTLKGIGYGGSETGYKYEFIVDGKQYRQAPLRIATLGISQVVSTQLSVLLLIQRVQQLLQLRLIQQRVVQTQNFLLQIILQLVLHL